MSPSAKTTSQLFLRDPSISKSDLHQDEVDSLCKKDKAQLQTLLANQDKEFFLIARMNQSGGVGVFASKKMIDWTQYQPEEVVGKSLEYLQNLFCCGNDVTAKDRLKAIFGLESANAMNAHLVCFKKDRTPFINEVSIRTLCDKDGESVLTVSHSNVYLLSPEELTRLNAAPPVMSSE